MVMTSLMKAVRIHAYGEPDVLIYEDAPRPKPAEGEVLVRVYAVGVNPVDHKTRLGRGVARRLPENPFPVIVGWDISGVVETVGAGVTQFKKGDEVYGMVHFPALGNAYAEYITSPAAHLALKPRSINHIQAATVPLAALTAWQALFDTANLGAGQKVLIHAAAGGVGHIAAQLAKWKGAYVLGTASTGNQEFLREIGVDEPIDYSITPFEQVAQNVDVVFDSIAGEITERSFKVLKPGGFLVAILSNPYLENAHDFGVQAQSILVHTSDFQLAEIASLIDKGHLRSEVSHVFSLAEAYKAHQQIASGHTRGKIALEVRKE
jgi:NADPH:quinone reductase